jgi:HSP20 family protein
MLFYGSHLRLLEFILGKKSKPHEDGIMAITRWRPRTTSEIAPYHWMENWPTRMMEEFFGPFQGDVMAWGPTVDILENPDSYEILAELPGVKPEDVKITVNNNMLTIVGEKRQEVREKGEGSKPGGEERNVNPLRVERNYGRFERSFTLPTSVNPEGVRAVYEDGILRILLPKAEEARARQINIETRPGGSTPMSPPVGRDRDQPMGRR